MRILFVGLGRIARRHIRNLALAAPGSRAAVLRRPESPPVDPQEVGLEAVFRDPGEALAWQPDAVFVTTPAPRHVASARPFVHAGIPLFVEKPLASDGEEAADFVAECRARGVPLMVGYVLRFHEPLRRVKASVAEGGIGRPLSFRAAVGRRLGAWRPGCAVRQGISARKATGGGVVLELSHELDLARWLMGEVDRTAACLERLGSEAVDVEDLAEISLNFRDGGAGHVHLDMLDPVAVRSLRIVGTEGTVVWDLFARPQARRLCPDGHAEDLGFEEDYNAMFVAELRHFLACVREGGAPEVDGGEGLKTLDVCLAAKRAAREGRWVRV